MEYRPSEQLKLEFANLSLDELAIECKKTFETDQSEYIDDLFQLGGSSGGARPKIYYAIEDEEWIVKFPSSLDKEILVVRNMIILDVRSSAVSSCQRQDYFLQRYTRDILQ